MEEDDYEYYENTDDEYQLLYDIEALKKKFNLYEVVIDTRHKGLEPFFTD